MDKSSIIVGVSDNKIYAYDGEEVFWDYYSELELKSLLEEIPKLRFDSMMVDSKTNDISCGYGSEVIIFRNIEKLRKFSSFAVVNEHLEKERSRLVTMQQKEKLKNRKKTNITRLAAFSLATMLMLPCSINCEALNKYVDYSNVTLTEIKEDEFSVGELDMMVLQGICTVGDNTFITAYDSSSDKDNSIIYILDKNNNCIKQATLYNNSHVGGICYDSKHEMFWITDKGGTISGYTYDSIFYDEDEVVIPTFRKIDVGSEDLINHKGSPSVAYIAYHDNRIFVGNFSINGNGILKSFEITDDGNIDIKSEKKVKFLDKVQGISFYEKDGEDYLLVSSSYGKLANSELKIFKFDEDCKDYSVVPSIKMDMPPMMEQITFNNKGKLVTLYESNALKYKGLKNNSSDVIVANIGAVVDNGGFKAL